MEQKTKSECPITTVVFDLDGTLLDTLTDLAESVNWTLEKFNLPLHTRDEIRNFVGNGYAKLIERSIPQGKENPLYTEIYNAARNHYSQISRNTTAPYQGILELLKKLSEMGISIAVNSNKPDRDVKELSEIYFSPYLTRETSMGENEAQGIKKKPAPDSLLALMEKFGATPQETLYVGDSDVDIQTALNAGVKPISCTWGFRSQQFLLDHGAQNLIHSPMELLDYLN